jgi:hypothetical protein
MLHRNRMLIVAVLAPMVSGCAQFDEIEDEPAATRPPAGEAARTLGVIDYDVEADDERFLIRALDTEEHLMAELRSHWEAGSHHMSYSRNGVILEAERSLHGLVIRAGADAEEIRGAAGVSIRELLDSWEGPAREHLESDLALFGAVADDFVFVNETSGQLRDTWPHRATVPLGTGSGYVNLARTRVRACDTDSDSWGVRTYYLAQGLWDIVGDANGAGGGCGEEGATGGPPVRIFWACSGPNGDDTVCSPTVVF